MNNNVLILGGGILGTELQRQTNWALISREKDGFDITQPETWDKYLVEYFQGMASTSKPKVIINCIANTNTYSDNKEDHWNVNYKGVADLVDFCNKWGIKLVHISTDYVYTNSKPFATENDIPMHGLNWYSYTKVLADAYVELRSNNYLICRGTHKPKPFPYPQAWWDQYGNFDYVDVIGKLIIELIETQAVGIYNVGTSFKSIYDLAIQTNKDVEPALKYVDTPSNTSMNVDKLNRKIKWG